MAEPLTLDKNAKITLGAAVSILLVIIGSASGGAWSMSALVATVHQLSGQQTSLVTQMGEMKGTLDSLAKQLTENEKTLAVLQKLVEMNEQRLGELERDQREKAQSK